MSDGRIPVIWHEGSSCDDKRSHYANCTLLNETLDAGFDFRHYSTTADVPQNAQTAVIVVNGGHEQGLEKAIDVELRRFQWSIIIVIGDEESKFQTRFLQGPNRKIWQQNPTPQVHHFANRFLICGYPSETQKYLAKHDRTSAVRSLDWFFAGQVTHSRRHQCVQVLNSIPNGKLQSTKHFFAQDLTPEDYYAIMSKAKIVPCPGGPCTPDTFRLAEALEAGCLPIVDDRPGLRAGYPQGYWENVFGERPPFPIVQNWTNLPNIMRQELAKWPRNRDAAYAWWVKYKAKMADWIRTDMMELQGKVG
jgi:hypothetical protein